MRARHLAHHDYYAEDERVMGIWQGHRAAELGLTGEVTEAQFESIRQRLHLSPAVWTMMVA
jgi:hypothetical protein